MTHAAFMAREILVCPVCRGALTLTGARAHCKHCECSFASHGTDGLDLRLQRPKKVVLEYEVGGSLTIGDELPDLSPLDTNPSPEVDFTNFQLPIHLPLAMASHLPKAPKSGSLCLDLGCGKGEYRSAVEHAGFRWVGVDHANYQAPLLADGHALPFASASFDLVVSLAVLEHVRFPYLVSEEVYRVLRPGGVFFGSVAYLTPFHSDSYFNMTHYGVLAVLRHAGFRVTKIAADQTYLGIRAIAFEGLFQGVARPIAYALVWPLVALYRLWWAIGRLRRLGQFSREKQYLQNTGAFVFYAQKPHA